MFMQVYNNTSLAHPASDDMTISDTQNNVYVPVVPGPTNLFAYRGGRGPREKPPAGTRLGRGERPHTGSACCCTRSRSSRSTTGRSS